VKLKDFGHIARAVRDLCVALAVLTKAILAILTTFK